MRTQQEFSNYLRQFDTLESDHIDARLQRRIVAALMNLPAHLQVTLTKEVKWHQIFRLPKRSPK